MSKLTVSTLFSLGFVAAISTTAAFASVPTTTVAGASRAATGAPTRTERAPARERMVCVDEERTGSRLRRRICQTEREWEADGGVPEAR